MADSRYQDLTPAPLAQPVISRSLEFGLAFGIAGVLVCRKRWLHGDRRIAAESGRKTALGPLNKEEVSDRSSLNLTP
jgi:hypothetical protein